FAALDYRALDRTEDLLLDPAQVLGVKQVEAHRLRARRGEQAHRNRNQAERDVAVADRTCCHLRYLPCGPTGTAYRPGDSAGHTVGRRKGEFMRSSSRGGSRR